MITLFVNTALKKTHVVIFQDEKLVGEERWEGYFHEFDTLLPKIEELLNNLKLKISEVGRLVVCHGPGGFTSVRLGVSTVNALSFSLDIPVAKISVFELIAFLHEEQKDFCVAIKANPSEVYVQGYGKWSSVFPEAVLMDKEKFEARIKNDCLLIADYEESNFQLPWDKLDFQKEVIEPWYYKEARITTSGKKEE